MMSKYYGWVYMLSIDDMGLQRNKIKYKIHPAA